MVERSNRRDELLNAATTLFIRQGYSATSIRQIADEVGCTEAAIYYHFKEGKRELFQEVVEREMPDFMTILDQTKDAATLREFIIRFGTEMNDVVSHRIGRMRWIVAEFPNLTDEEKAIFHRKHLRFNRELTRIIQEFVSSEALANRIAWTLTCAGFGYNQIFHNLEVCKVADFKLEDMIAMFANMADVLVAMQQVITPPDNQP